MYAAVSIGAFLEEVAKWASTREDILAVALAGSRAWGAAREDSGIDLLLPVRTPEKYLADAGWPAPFGAVRRRQKEPCGKVTSIRVWYDDGREVEFGWTSREWAEKPLDEGTRRVILEGMRVNFERGTILSRLLTPPASP